MENTSTHATLGSKTFQNTPSASADTLPLPPPKAILHSIVAVVRGKIICLVTKVHLLMFYFIRRKQWLMKKNKKQTNHTSKGLLKLISMRCQNSVCILNPMVLRVALLKVTKLE